MRSYDDVQKAHDTLWAVIADEIDVGFSDDEKKLVMAQLDVLCWVLKHDHVQAFAENLELVEQLVAKSGFRLTKLPIPLLSQRLGRG